MSEEDIESFDEETKTIPANFNEKKPTLKTRNFYILLAVLCITIALLIAASINCYLRKYQQKKTKHLSTFYVTNNKLKEVMY